MATKVISPDYSSIGTGPKDPVKLVYFRANPETSHFVNLNMERCLCAFNFRVILPF